MTLTTFPILVYLPIILKLVVRDNLTSDVRTGV